MKCSDLSTLTESMLLNVRVYQSSGLGHQLLGEGNVDTRALREGK
jgi:hypothetical protein